MSGARAEDGRIAAGRAGFTRMQGQWWQPNMLSARSASPIATPSQLRAQFFPRSPPSSPPTFSDPLAAAGSGTRMGRGWDERMEALPYVHPRW